MVFCLEDKFLLELFDNSMLFSFRPGSPQRTHQVQHSEANRSLMAFTRNTHHAIMSKPYEFQVLENPCNCKKKAHRSFSTSISSKPSELTISKKNKKKMLAFLSPDHPGIVRWYFAQIRFSDFLYSHIGPRLFRALAISSRR